MPFDSDDSFYAKENYKLGYADGKYDVQKEMKLMSIENHPMFVALERKLQTARAALEEIAKHPHCDEDAAYRAGHSHWYSKGIRVCAAIAAKGLEESK